MERCYVYNNFQYLGHVNHLGQIIHACPAAEGHGYIKISTNYPWWWERGRAPSSYFQHCNNPGAGQWYASDSNGLSYKRTGTVVRYRTRSVSKNDNNEIIGIYENGSCDDYFA